MDAAAPTAFWKKCSVCKKPIGFKATYYICSVSSCNGQRTGYSFCSVGCFESHIPGARHKSAGALERISPSQAEAETAVATANAGPISQERAPQRVMARPSPMASSKSSGAPSSSSSSTSSAKTSSSSQMPREVLVIASRLKEYITARSDYNTSQSVMDVLSDHLRIICDRAIDQARSEGRKTVMDRDFSFLKNN